MKDIIRMSVAVPSLRVADVSYNKEQIIAAMERASERGATVVAFPELSLTGYSCGDLFLSDLLADRARDALADLAVNVPAGMLAAVGAPLMIGGQVYNCAVLLGEGRILGAVPKTYLPDYGEHAERRWFTSGADLSPVLASIGCFTFPVSTDLLFRAADGTVVGVELCEDAAAPLPPSAFLALAGAEIILNLSATSATVKKRDSVRAMIAAQSARLMAAYVYAGAGYEESVADTVCNGQGLIACEGKILSENANVTDTAYVLVADVDLGALRYDRRHNRTFGESAARYAIDVESVALDFPLCTSDGTQLSISRLPFIPDNAKARELRSAEIFDIQTTALARRLSIVGGKAVIGISGGLDSTLAVLVAVRAMEKLSLPASNVTAVTMPCFGTSDETLANSLALMEALGVTARTVPIKDAVLQHFKDIGHDVNDYSVTYENAQARERTQVLMDVANQVGGIVIGTGDLSEMALGWCTYNGDHMSMYAVNCDVPKTLVRWVITALADADVFPRATDVLRRVLDTPISPELLPPDAVGKISQKTEDLVGPYALHDFFLYYAVRYQYTPTKIYEMANIAFAGMFDPATVKKWLTVFYRRFFTQQFKRNCTPDGVKVGSVALSPRGDWRMPSDASAAEWLREIEEL